MICELWIGKVTLPATLHLQKLAQARFILLHWAWHRAYFISLIYSQMSARSFSFLMPAKTIFVPGIYFFGFTKYSYMCLSDQMIPEFLLASEYANPSTVPDCLPKRPNKGGPCFARPPFSIVWHCAHLALNNFAPFFASPSGTSTTGSATTMSIRLLANRNQSHPTGP